jgi:hypothetical protein
LDLPRPCGGKSEEHLSEIFFQRYRKHFHIRTDGLIQLTIREKENQFLAVITEIGSVDISEYVEKELLLSSPDEFI